MTIKNLKFIVTALFAVLVMTSCSEKDETLVDPTITLESPGLTGDVTVTASATATTPLTLSGSFRKGVEGKDLTEVRIAYAIKSEGTSGSKDDYFLDPVAGGTISNKSQVSFTKVFDFKTMAVGAADDMVTFTLKATDKDGKTAEKIIKVTVKAPVDTTPVVTPPVVKSNITFSNVNAYFAAATGTGAVEQAAANPIAANIDLVYFFRDSDKAHSFISPAALKAAPYVGTAAEWANGTVASDFKTTTATVDDFNAAKADQTKIAPIYVNGTPSVYVGNTDGIRIKTAEGTTVVNEVFAFKGKDGKRGLVHVKSALDTGSVTVDVIIEN